MGEKPFDFTGWTIVDLAQRKESLEYKLATERHGETRARQIGREIAHLEFELDMQVEGLEL